MIKVFHQTGFRYNWNIDSFNDHSGDGLIYSPINIDSESLLSLEPSSKVTSFLDPQLYLLNEDKGKLNTYPYFPDNLKSGFSTNDLSSQKKNLAKLCIDFQFDNDFEYITIPTRYYSDNPTHFYQESSEFFVNPFCEYIEKKSPRKKVLLSVIVKQIMLNDEVQRNEVLNWITSHQHIDGVYLIFENNFPSKQIKDFDYLLNALNFIKVLKSNSLEVHLGYTNTEALLYSVAMPDSITIGSYENLRSFNISRFVNSENDVMRGPRARLYSSKLLQWIDYQYIEAMKKLLSSYSDYFDDSLYRPLMFSAGYNWHFQKPEPYKHYFYVFAQQVRGLSVNQGDRKNEVMNSISGAIDLFKIIKDKVLLDEDSNDSHLPTWMNVLNAFQQ